MPPICWCQNGQHKGKAKGISIRVLGLIFWRNFSFRTLQMLLCTVRRDSRRIRVQIYTFFWILTPFFNKVLYNSLYFNKKKFSLYKKKVPKTNRIPSFYTISLLTLITSYPPHKTTHTEESYAPHNLHCYRQKYSPSRSAHHRLNGVSAWIDTDSAYSPLCWPLPPWGLTLLLQLSDGQPCSVQLCPYSANLRIENWELRIEKWKVKSEKWKFLYNTLWWKVKLLYNTL